MIYCNPVPIASASLLSKDVVSGAMSAFIKAIADLVKYGRNVDLNFGFCRMSLFNKNLKVTFRNDFSQEISNKDFETKMARATSPVSQTWKQTYGQTWARSTMSKLVSRPNQTVVETLAQKTAALKMMSLDMSSAAAIKKPTSAAASGLSRHK